MTTTGRPPARRLHPDELAALEEQKEFLLRSLDDLDAERAAGDIDDADHRALADDYTARAAEVLRRIDDRKARSAPAGPQRPARTLLWVAGVATVAVLAGVFVAQAAGRRDTGDPLSGGIRETTRAQVAGCQGDLADGEVLAAIECFDDVLAEAPDNVEALTYRGWALVLTGDERLVPTGLEYLQRAVDADPEFLDARVFRAIVFERQGEADDARAELAVIDAADAPPAVRELVAPLRERLEEEVP